MAATLDPNSWVRLPVPLSNLPVTIEPESESFSPANTLTLSELDDDVDDATLFKLLPRDDTDQLVTDRQFLPPVAPFSLIEPTVHRTITRLKAIVYPYALTAEGGAQADITSNATASTVIYPVPVAYAGSRAQVETTVTDVAPPPPADLLLESGSLAPVLGAAKVPYGSSEAEDWVFLLDGRYVDPVTGPDPESDDWDYSEKQVFLTGGYLTINGTQHEKGAVMSASYIGFPETATLDWNPTPGYPAFDKLVLAGGDLMSRVMAVQKGSNYVKVRNEIGDWNGTWVNGDGLAPLIVWEATFFEPLEDGTQYIEVRVGDFDQALLNQIIEWEYAFSSDVYLSAADGTLLATAPLAPNTSYVFVGNAAGSQWAVQTGAHINNLTGFYAKPIVPVTRTEITAVAETPLTATTLTFFGEKPTSFFAVETYTGTGSTLTRTANGLYPLMVWTKHNGVDFWFGAPAFNAGGTNGVTGTDPNGGTPGLPKGRKIGYAYDASPSTLSTGGYLSFFLGGYQIGATVNTNTSSNQALAWAFGAYGPPKVNKAGVAFGGRESIVSRGPLGISFFAFTGVPVVDFPADGMAVGHGLADEDGNPLTPEIVFINQYFYNFYFRSPIGVAGRALPPVTYGTTTYDTHLQLGKREGSSNAATAAAAAMSGSTAYLQTGKLADDKVVWVGSAMNSTNAMAMGMAFANVPGSCAVKTFTSQGAVNTIELGFKPQLVILKCTSATSNWVVFSEQSFMSGKSLNLHTIENPITTNGSAGLVSYGLTWTRSISDAGATWLVIAVAGKARGERQYAVRAEAGAATLSGRNAALLKYQGAAQLTLIAAAATFAVGQQSAGLVWLRRLNLLAGPGSTGLLGQAAAFHLLRAYALVAAVGNLAAEGKQANLLLVTSLAAQSGSFAATAQAAALAGSYRLKSQAGSVIAAGQSADLVVLQDYAFLAGAGQFALNGQPGSLSIVLAFPVQAGGFAIGLADAQLATNRRLAAAGGAIQLSAQASALSSGRLLGSEAASLAVAGQSTALRQQRVLFAEAGGVVASGNGAGNVRTYGIGTNAGSFFISGQQASSIYLRNSFAVEAGSVALTGQSAGRLLGFSLQPSAGAFTAQGQAADRIKQIIGISAAGAFALNGSPVAGYGYSIRAGNVAPVLGATSTATASGWTQIINGSADDASIGSGDFGFAFSMAGTSYTSCFIGSNGYLTFGSGSTVYSGVGAGNPALNKVLFFGGDRSWRNVYTQTGTTDSGKYFKVRWEGAADTSGGVSALIEVALFKGYNELQFVEIRYGNNTLSSWTAGVASSSAYYASVTAAPNTSVAFKGNATGSSWTATNSAYVGDGPPPLSIQMAAAVGAFTVAGQGASSQKAITLSCAVMAMSVTGQAANLQQPEALLPAYNRITYTGTASARSITGVNFQPSLIWINNLSAALNGSPYVFDSLRGTGKFFDIRFGQAQFSDAQTITAFGPDGFSLGTSTTTNSSNTTYRDYEAYCWKLGAKTTTNTAGSRTSTTSVNNAQSVSAFTYTGSNVAGATVGHGMTSTPEFVMVKIYSGATGAAQAMSPLLGGSYAWSPSDTSAALSSTDYIRSIGPTTITLGGAAAVNGPYSYVGYAFRSVPGLSKIGTVSSNGAGTVSVDLGFMPDFLLIKTYVGTGEWSVYRPTNDAEGYATYITLSNRVAPTVSSRFQITTTGFSIDPGGYGNAVGGGSSILYMAFAGKVRGPAFYAGWAPQHYGFEELVYPDGWAN